VDTAQPVSKTQRKKQMLKLQKLGETLVKLKAEQLGVLDLPETLRTAVDEAKRIKGFEATRRQMQYIGRLMRDVNVEPIRARLAEWEAPAHRNVAQLHLVEHWRERILAEDVDRDALAEVFPALDFERLQTVAVAARAQTGQSGTPKHRRMLFRLLHAGLGHDNEVIAEPTSQPIE
jgi:ribosome-associated protein